MLISLKLNNCFIYNNEVEFTMKADMRSKNLSSNVITDFDVNVVKSAVIFGPNNSGKTKFVESIEALKGIILDEKNVILSNFYTDSYICEFELDFISDGTEYVFNVKYDASKKTIVYESFSRVSYDHYRNRSEVTLFIRDIENNSYICQDNKDLATAMKYSSENNLLIHLFDVSKFDILKIEKTALTSFAEKIDIIDMNNIPISKTIELLKSSDDERERIVKFILNSDLSLSDYRYLSDEEMKTVFEPFWGISPKENAVKPNISASDMFHLMSFYKGIPLPSLIFDSTGTKKMAALASYVIDALEHGRILVVDELDNSLHFKLTRAIISLFNNDMNKRAQLICTVHDVSLLDCQRLFRKEQIWFANKDDKDVYLYSLSEFTAGKDGVRDTSSIIEKYKRGMFGAIPEPDLFASLMEVCGDG